MPPVLKQCASCLSRRLLERHVSAHFSGAVVWLCDTCRKSLRTSEGAAVEEMRRKKCEICGVYFRVSGAERNRRVCSSSCHVHLGVKIARGRWANHSKVTSCEGCKKSFTRDRPRQKTCSRACLLRVKSRNGRHYHSTKHLPPEVRHDLSAPSLFSGGEMNREQIEAAFVYHKPSAEQAEDIGRKYVQIRESARKLALEILELTPASREQSLAHTKLQEVMMWSNAAIAINLTAPDTEQRDRLLGKDTAS